MRKLCSIEKQVERVPLAHLRELDLELHIMD